MNTVSVLMVHLQRFIIDVFKDFRKCNILLWPLKYVRADETETYSFLEN